MLNCKIIYLSAKVLSLGNGTSEVIVGRVSPALSSICSPMSYSNEVSKSDLGWLFTSGNISANRVKMP